jgi:selenide, water dikinase
VLGDLRVPNDRRVLIDYRTSDDAGVYAIGSDRALVQTVDFFTPIVDDPFLYGQIAAANALSDVYAMGGEPLTALAIACFPKDGDRDVLKTIFAGGLDKLREAGVALLGGHTIQDHEIKFGYAVTGDVSPSAIWANAGARVGDALILTKPIGTGIIATALKFQRATPAAVDAAAGSMATLNRAASAVLKALPPGVVHGVTDVTGFGLIGHASEVAAASGCTLELVAGRVPLLPDLFDLVDQNVPGGGRTNAQHFATRSRIDDAVDPRLVQILHDPQTSGGLLVALDRQHADVAVERLRQARVTAALVGSVSPRGSALVIVRG